MIGASHVPGVITYVGLYSSKVRLFTDNEDITLMNDYIDKVNMDIKEHNLKIGDLVELKPKVKRILSLRGVGTIIAETVIKSSNFDGKEINSFVDSYLVYFAEEDYTYTIPKNCLRLFSK